MILETKISKFKSTYKTEVDGTISVREALMQIKRGTHKTAIEKLRKGDKAVKQNLPLFAFHGLFEFSRKASDFIEASGIIILDIDGVDLDEINETKEIIMEEDDSVLAAMTSPSGNGIKILYYVDPELVTAQNYKQVGKQVITRFDDYGHVDNLSVTDCLIVSYDPDIQINQNVKPAFIYLDESKTEVAGELEERDTSLELWTDVEEFFETVLYADIAGRANNNFHFIQMSLLDLAKFGFYHPAEDLSFVVEYAETDFKRSSENKRRLMEASELANSYPQTRWAYNTTKSEDDEFEEEENWRDYSDQIEHKPKRESSDNEDGSSDSGSDEEEDGDGLINYVNFFDRVKETIAEGDRVGHEVSFSNMAEGFRFRGSGILTVTGIPGSGKTEFIDAVTLDLARLYGHETLIAGFEQSSEEHVIKLIRKVIGTDITCPSWSDHKKTKEAYDFITSKFKHIDTNKSGGNINKILNTATDYIAKSRANGGNPKYLVLDPFNMLSIKSKASGHEKIEQILRTLTQFSHQMDILIILIAHPFKMKKDEKTKEYEVPDFYSVKGSSAFFEMSYHGLVVYRKSDGSVLVKVLKIKQNNLGTTGAEFFFDYHKASGRYIPIDEQGNELAGDHYNKDWIEKVNVVLKSEEEK